jgi:uncharacterized protein (DUF2141 family)
MAPQDIFWSTNQFGSVAVQPKGMSGANRCAQLAPAFSDAAIKYQEARALMSEKFSCRI